MKNKILVFDPTSLDKKSAVRGVGRYLQILKENFPNWNFTNKLVNPLTHNWQTIFINPFFNFLQPPLTIRRISEKQIAVIHDLIPLKYPSHFPVGIKGKLNIFLNKLALKNYDLIITDSEASKKDIIQILGINEKKVRVIYPCLPKIFTQNQNSKLKNLAHRQTGQNYSLKFKNNKTFNFSLLTSKFCLYVGDATWNKNLVNLAKAIKIINVTCVFVGKVFERINPKSQTLNSKQILNSNDQNLKQKSLEYLNLENLDLFRISNLEFRISHLNHPWQKELKEFFEETKNDKRFIFLGFIPDEELIKLYQQARCNLLVSRDEGFGFSFLEAASQKCPSVLSNISVLKEISSDSGLYVNPESPEEIANAIGEIYFNDDYRDKIGGKTYQRSKFFSSLNFKKSFVEIVKTVK